MFAFVHTAQSAPQAGCITVVFFMGARIANVNNNEFECKLERKP